MATLFRRRLYYSRLVVPVDLRAILARRELWRCLYTASYRDARTKAALWEGRLARLFLYLRQNHQRMKIEQIKRLVQQYVSSTLEACEDDRAARVVDDDERDALGLHLTDQLEETHFLLLGNTVDSRTAEKADALLEANKIMLPKDSPAYRRLCRELLKGEQTILRAEIDRLDGKYFEPRSAAYSALPAASQGAESVALGPSKVFSEALRDYFTHYEHRGTRTNVEKKVVFKRFMESLGGDRLLEDITKADCVRFRDACSQLPRRIPNKYRGKLFADILADIAATQPDCVRVTKGTVNQALTSLRHFFNWAVKHDYYAGKNPAEGIEYEGVEQKSYEPFADQDLTRVFGRKEFSAQRKKQPGRYWIPLVLLYTGARREEIAQLSLTDIQQEKGVWFFDIAPDEEGGKRLKNKASKRRVPVHSHLIALGLLDYVAAMKAREERQLFPLLKKKEKGRATVGDAVGKWFSRQLKAAKVTGHKTLHSFRHTAITHLTDAGVPQDMREILVGHASDTVHGKTYTHRESLSLPPLRSHIEKLDFRAALAGLNRGKPRR